jgi:hypothetical protein
LRENPVHVTTPPVGSLCSREQVPTVVPKGMQSTTKLQKAVPKGAQRKFSAQKSFQRERRAYSEKSTPPKYKAKCEMSTRYRRNRRRRSSKDVTKGMQNLQRKVSADTSKNKRQRDFSHSQGNKGYGCGFVCVCLVIHLLDTLHYTFAFINIHLDIHRIIIIITYIHRQMLRL